MTPTLERLTGTETMITATMTTAETKAAPKVVVIDRNRDVVTGRFAPRAAKWGVTTVLLGNGKVGYRNGAAGPIFASRESAVSRALAVRPSIVHVGPIKKLVGPIAPKPVAPAKAARPARPFAEGIETAYEIAWLDERAAGRRYDRAVDEHGERSEEARDAYRAYLAAKDRLDAEWRIVKARETAARGGSWDSVRGGCYTGD